MTRDLHQECADWLTSVAAGPVYWGTFASLGSPVAAEVLAGLGYDVIVVDLQHGHGDLATLHATLAAIEAAGAAPVVRTLSDDPAMIGRALDLGAWAVVVPMVNNEEQARRAVDAAAYAPHGTRSFGPVRGRASDMARRVLVMVETAEGLANLPSIARVDGLLGIFAGPSDLALGLGLEVDYALGSGRHHEAMQAIAAECADAGILAATQTAGADEALLRVRQGFRLVSMRSDILVMRTEAQRMLAAARDGI